MLISEASGRKETSMKKASGLATLLVTLVLGISGAENSSGRAPTRSAPNLKADPARMRLCPKADLPARDDRPLGFKDEFPFASPCRPCWEQLGPELFPRGGFIAF
jgi:hypothetical protein